MAEARNSIYVYIKNYFHGLLMGAQYPQVEWLFGSILL